MKNLMENKFVLAGVVAFAIILVAFHLTSRDSTNGTDNNISSVETSRETHEVSASPQDEDPMEIVIVGEVNPSNENSGEEQQ